MLVFNWFSFTTRLVIEFTSNVSTSASAHTANGSPFFHTISEFIKFRTVASINNRSAKTLLMETRAIVNMYKSRGFNVTRLEADQEFQCITNDVLPTILNVADADDHVHEVERSIRTIKERTRCTVQGLPFRRMPKIMVRAAVEGAHKALHQFPAKNGISKVLSPLTIMTGQPKPDFNDFKIEFGAYALVFEDNDPTNTMRTRATRAIALTPTGNTQGGHYFMSLTTGKRLSRQQWDELPMPDGVIAAVEAMAVEQKQPPLNNGGPVFEWSPGITIADDTEGPAILDLDERGADEDESTDGGMPKESDEEDEEGSEAESEEDDSEDGNPKQKKKTIHQALGGS
jgi:hypothetical protein